jgi:hypothetical protein
MMYELESWIAEKVSDVVAVARYQIVDTHDVMPLFDKQVGQMRSEEPGSTRNQDSCQLGALL